MSIDNWTILKGHLQGDISYDLRKVLTTAIYVELELVAFGEKWKEFDIAFEYRLNEKETWKEDAIITETSASYLRGNRLYGLTASKDGITHTIIWKYSENNILYSAVPQIRLRFLPRVRMFGTINSNHSISTLYGDSLINLDGISRHDCIGIDNSGNYMCLGSHSFYIIDDLDTEEESTSSYSSSSGSSESLSSSNSSSSSFSSSKSSSSSESSSSSGSSSSSSSSTEVRSSSSTEIRTSSSSSSSSIDTLYGSGFIVSGGAGNGTYNPVGTFNSHIIYRNTACSLAFMGIRWAVGVGGSGTVPGFSTWEKAVVGGNPEGNYRKVSDGTPEGVISQTP